MKKYLERTSCLKKNQHKRIFKIAALLLSALSVLISLTACGSSTPSEMTASEAFKQDSIWFTGGADDGAISKDKDFSNVLVFQDGKVSCYQFYTQLYDDNTANKLSLKQTCPTYGDLNGLSDKEILDKIKKIDKNNFENNKKGALAECKDKISNREDAIAKCKLSGRTIDSVWLEATNKEINFYKKRLSELKKLSYKEPQPVSYKLSIRTDNSGNDAVSEKIEFTPKLLDGGYLNNNSTTKNTPYQSQKKVFVIKPGIGTQTIYDTKFSGYDDLFTIVKDENTTFTLDNRKSKGVELE